MKKQITALLILLPHVGCVVNDPNSNETDILQDSTVPIYWVRDASPKDSYGEKDTAADTDGDLAAKGIGDTGLLDVSVIPVNADEDASQEASSGIPENSSSEDSAEWEGGTEIDVEETLNDGQEDHQTNPEDVAHDASPEANDANQETALNDSGLNCSRGCALQGRFACWPIQEHPTFDVVVSDFIVKDRCTGLYWESHVNSNSADYSFDDAGACKSKGLPIPKGVTAQWRMPTRLELVSIFDYSLDSPVLDLGVFAPSTDEFWTSSQTADGLSGWTLTTYQGNVCTKPKTRHYYGRCVLDPMGDAYQASTLTHYDQSVAGEVRDLATLLTWEAWDSQNGSTRTLINATSYCQNKGTDWRLPSIKELLTIISDENTINSALFPNVILGNYWTATTVYDGGVTSRHWALHFGTGLTSGTETSAYVRCVK